MWPANVLGSMFLVANPMYEKETGPTRTDWASVLGYVNEPIIEHQSEGARGPGDGQA